MNLEAIKRRLTAELMVLMENTPPASKEKAATDVIAMMLDLLAFHREQAAETALAGVQELFVHPEDGSMPEHWGSKPFARICTAETPADLPVGILGARFWAFAESEHQKGTVLGDLLELRADVKTLYDAAIDDRVNGNVHHKTDQVIVKPEVIDNIAGAFGEVLRTKPIDMTNTPT